MLGRGPDDGLDAQRVHGKNQSGKRRAQTQTVLAAGGRRKGRTEQAQGADRIGQGRESQRGFEAQGAGARPIV